MKGGYLGRSVAQAVEQAQRLCPHLCIHGFDSTCRPLLHVIPSLSRVSCLLFSCPIQEIKAQTP